MLCASALRPGIPERAAESVDRPPCLLALLYIQQHAGKRHACTEDVSLEYWSSLMFYKCYTSSELQRGSVPTALLDLENKPDDLVKRARNIQIHYNLMFSAIRTSSRACMYIIQ